MILILTPYSFNPLHPRLEYIEKYLIQNGYDVKKYNLNCKNRIVNKLNWLSLTFFQVPALFKSIKYLWKYKKETRIVYIQDLQYLHIAIIAKIFRKKVIYDTLDNNVELNFYHLSNRFSIFKKLLFTKTLVEFLEKKMAKYFCDEIVVNSKALVEYLKPIKTNLLYYTSPFENKFELNSSKETALLYLGGFWKMKGSHIILDFVEKYNRKLFIFGSLNSKEKDIIERISFLDDKGLVSFTERVSSVELENKLSKLFQKYKFIGFSLTQTVNISNATQEINKDIDYLAMGIPLLANHRKPTEEKINEGCGVFIEDELNLERLLRSNDYYQEISNRCITYYNQNYNQNIFEEKLLDIIHKGIFK